MDNLNDLIIIRNPDSGFETNYFETDFAKAGRIFLSKNDRDLQLLLPEKIAGTFDETVNSSTPSGFIKEIETADHVIISKGKHSQLECFEFLFEDFTDTPFSLYISTNMCDREPILKDVFFELNLSIWTKQGKILSLPCYYRQVNKLPCLKALPKSQRKRKRCMTQKKK